MKNQPEFANKFFLRFIVCLFVLLGTAESSSAQRIGASGFPAIVNDSHYTEWQMKKLRANVKPRTGYDLIAWRQIREDYKQLQIANNGFYEMNRIGVESKARDYHGLVAQIEQIEKRAAALKRRLPLPVADAPVSPPISESSFAAECELLDQAVLSFVKSPIFKDTEVLNVAAGQQAGRDLDTIIRLSESLKERIGKLSRTAP